MKCLIACIAALAALDAAAGGSNYGVVPGSRDIAGKISEWAVPTPRFARDPAPGPDGNIYIAVMNGNRIARFDTKTRTFKEWDLPDGARPHGLVVARDGRIFYTGNGNGSIGELDPATGKVISHFAPSQGGNPHTAVLDDEGNVWFTGQGGGYLGKLDRKTGKISEYPMSGGPYGLAIDRQGRIWVCRMGANALGVHDPKTGRTEELRTGSGTRPRRIAAAPDGTLWVTYYGNGMLAKVDPAAMKVVKEYPMPAGPRGGPYAVAVDGAGRVWANEIDTDTVALFDPKSEKFRVFQLPSSGVGIRKAIVDAEGRYWYMGSHNGKLGVIE
ncbi:MAG: virginiamycin B lyase family protein [Burkholderiales bacterium]